MYLCGLSWEIFVQWVPLMRPLFCVDSFKYGTIITIATIQVVISRKRA